MYFSINAFVFINIFNIVTQSEISRRQNKLLIFKTDMNKIGNDLENFIFDIAKEVVRKTDGFIESDYGTDYEDSASEEEIESSKHSEQSKQLNKTLAKNTFEKEHLTAKVNETVTSVNSDGQISSKIRHKRSTNEDAPETFDIALEEKPLGATSNVQDPHCANNHLSERKHIDDLREEVKKLYELVVLLRDQQKILSQLNNSSSDIPKRFESKDLLKVLEHLSDNDVIDKPGLEESSFSKISDDLSLDKIAPTREELETLKYDFKQAILALNETRIILDQQNHTEIELEKEIQQQKNELNRLKIMVDKLIQNANFTSVRLSDKKVEDISDTQIVGTPLHLPKNMPTIIKKYGKTNEPMKKSTYTTQQKPSTRASELEDLSQLFNEIDKPNLSDMELKIMELQENIEKKKKEENLKKQLIMLQKLLDKQQNSANSNSLLSDDSESSKKMKLLLKIITRPQKKSDDDIEDELVKLQVAIDKMKHKGEFDPLDLSGDERAQLKEILNGRGQLGQLGDATRGQQHQLTPQEVIELKKKLDQLTSDGSKKVNSMNQNMDFKVGPQPFPFWSEFNSNFDKVFSPYNNFPYPMNYNGYGYDGSYSYNYPINNKPQRFMPNYNPYPPFPFYQPNPNVDNNGKYYKAQRTGQEYSEPTFVQPQSNTPNEKNEHFFLAPQPQQNFYYRPDTDHNAFSEDIKGGGSEQPEPYLPENVQYGNYRAKSIEDLKFQINSLQSIINDLNNPGLAKRPEDQQLIGHLEQEINELKNIVNNLNADTPPIPGNVQPPSYNQQKIPASPDSSEHRLSKRFVETDEGYSNSKLFDEISRKLKSYLFDENETVAGTHRGIENQVTTFKKELDEQLKGTQRSYSPSAYPQNYPHFNFPYNHPSYSSFSIKDISNKIQTKKTDLLTSIILKIFDKISAIIPVVIKKIFGQAFYGLTNTQYSYDSDHDLMYGGVNDIQNVFYNFGLIGYIPLILLKIINVLSVFVNFLKKNKFIRNTLLPVLVLLLVSGLVLFLIWWLQPDGTYPAQKQIGYDYRQDYSVGGNYNDRGNYQRIGGNTQLYSRNHGNGVYRRNGYMPMAYSRSYYENGQNINDL